MKSIVINLTQRCNARCAHCCFECLPGSSNYLTDDEIDKIVSYAESHEDVQVVSLTGGEALMLKSKVIEIITRLSLANKDVTLITNGFWATNENRTRNILKELSEAGLRYLTVSFDDFHAEFINPTNIRHLLRIVTEFDIEIAMNMVVDRKHPGVDLLKELSDAVFGIPITMVPAAPIGRAKSLNLEDLYLKDVDELSLTCPATGWEFVVHHDGYIYPCCSPSIFESSLRLGNISESEIDVLEDKFYSNILLYILKSEGLSWFIVKMDLDLSNQRFVSTCEICRYIFSDSNLIKGISDDIKEYYEENFASIS